MGEQSNTKQYAGGPVNPFLSYQPPAISVVYEGDIITPKPKGRNSLIPENTYFKGTVRVLRGSEGRAERLLKCG